MPTDDTNVHCAPGTHEPESDDSLTNCKRCGALLAKITHARGVYGSVARDTET